MQQIGYTIHDKRFKTDLQRKIIHQLKYNRWPAIHEVNLLLPGDRLQWLFYLRTMDLDGIQNLITKYQLA